MTSTATHEQQKAIRDLWARNVPYRDIAREVRISHSRIKDVMEAMGLPDRRAVPEDVQREIMTLHYQGHGYRAICDAVGRSERVVRRVIAKNKTEVIPTKLRTRWTPEEIEAFHNGWNPDLGRNENVRRIAEKLGRHPDGILSKAKMAGLIENSPCDPSKPSPERAALHAKACLAEGGFPWREVVQGRTVEFRPARLEAEAA